MTLTSLFSRFAILPISMMLWLGMGSAYATLSPATLPDPITKALTTAGLTQDDISMVIIPINHSTSAAASVQPTHAGNSTNVARLSSHLPTTVHPKSNIKAQDYIDTRIISHFKIKWLTHLDAVLRQASKSHVNRWQDLGSQVPNEVMTQNKNNAINSKGINLDAISHLAFQSETIYPDARPLLHPIRHRASIPRTPASTMKLIPTFIALDLLGKDFVWQTQVYHTGYIINNTLHGDLIIKGSGDPKLTYNRLKQMLSYIQQLGIYHIEGNIILDSSIFQNVGKDPAQFDNDPLRPYNASPDGLLVNFNSMEIATMPQANGQVALRYSPRLADYTLPTTIHQRSGRCQSIKLSLAPVFTADRLVYGKRLPRGCGSHLFYIAYPNPKQFAERVIKQQWLELGGTLQGHVLSTERPNMTALGTYSAVQDSPLAYRKQATLLPASRVPIVSYGSFTLGQQIYDINHYSNNVMTEQVMLSIPAYAHDTLQDPSALTASATTRAVSYPNALNSITQWWRQHLHRSPPNMTNGSGLCRECTISADNLAALLEYAYTHPSFNTYVNSLGIAGVDGTIVTHRWRMPNSAAIGRAWIKTGTLDNVTAMAGYVKGRSQQDYVVVGIINTPYKLNATKARRVLDTMLDWTATH